MAAKPTLSNAEWATDATFSSGPDSGQNTKVSASAGVKAQGWRPGDALGFVGAWFNYWQNQIYAWMAYLSDGAFTGNTEFSGGTFAVAGEIQADGGIAVNNGNHLRLSGEANYDALRTFTVRRGMSGTGATGPDTRITTYQIGGVALAQDVGSTTAFVYHQPVELPQDAEITGWRALVESDSSGGALVTGQLYRVEHTFGGSPSVDTGTPVGGSDTSSGGAVDTIGVSGLSEPVDNTTSNYVLVISDPLTPGVSPLEMYIYGYEITYEMPGLRQAGG